jgi:hypothetical protein
MGEGARWIPPNGGILGAGTCLVMTAASDDSMTALATRAPDFVGGGGVFGLG